MSYLETTHQVQDAYAALAPHYDRFMAGAAYENWLGRIEAWARDLGLTGTRVLDVACGTGNSFAPLLGRGYEVSGCDLSPEMLGEARRKYADRVEDLFVADMRDLPALGTFDLVTCIEDALNYLLSPEDLVAAFRSVAEVLADDGIYAFDVNSVTTYRTAFSTTSLAEDPEGLFCWHGEADDPFEPGDAASATIEAFVEAEDGLWRRVSSRHVQRHHPPEVIHEALAAAELECVAVAGHRPGGYLEDCWAETDHAKLVYFARKREVREGVI